MVRKRIFNLRGVEVKMHFSKTGALQGGFLKLLVVEVRCTYIDRSSCILVQPTQDAKLLVNARKDSPFSTFEAHHRSAVWF